MLGGLISRTQLVPMIMKGPDKGSPISEAVILVAVMIAETPISWAAGGIVNAFHISPTGTAGSEQKIHDGKQ